VRKYNYFKIGTNIIKINCTDHSAYSFIIFL